MKRGLRHFEPEDPESASQLLGHSPGLCGRSAREERLTMLRRGEERTQTGVWRARPDDKHTGKWDLVQSLSFTALPSSKVQGRHSERGWRVKKQGGNVKRVSHPSHRRLSQGLRQDQRAGQEL